MSRTSQCTVTPIDPSTRIDFGSSHPLANLLKVATSTSLSVEARLLYVILCLMAWSKHYCWPSQQYQAEALGRSERQVRRYHKELERAGVLGINRLPGKSSRYYPWALRTQDTDTRTTPDTGVRVILKPESTKHVKNVPPPPHPTRTSTPPSPDVNVNATKSEPFPADNPTPLEPVSPQDGLDTSSPITYEPRHTASKPVETHTDVGPKLTTPITHDQIFLVEDIERVTGDTWSRGHFVNLVRQFNEQTIYAALSVTREKLALESGVNGGAYFTSTLKGMAQLGTMKSHKLDPTTTTTSYDYDAPKPTVTTSPVMQELPDSELIDPEGLINGLKFSYKSGGVKTMLLWADRSVTGIDTQALWGQVEEVLQANSESDRVHRFLETLKVRLKHQSATAATG